MHSPQTTARGFFLVHRILQMYKHAASQLSCTQKHGVPQLMRLHAAHKCPKDLLTIRNRRIVDETASS